eukprot:Phypoly_transcript_01797.p1 GENE.Phypoly_transcript_01797~~Phypoly_transcript_01797.p1  ORF type:complete len:950 (+),score=160.92 Phypoly_transcript_01797:263-3112(+)
MAIASGAPLRMLYLFIADEVKESDPFKPNSDATKVIQFYWDMVAKRYLKESLTPIITLLTSTNKTISLEIDQSKLNFWDADDLPKNRTVLIDHVNQLVNKLVSKEMVDKIPIPIKALLAQIFQLGKERGKYLCALVYFSYFVCNAVADPNTARITGGRFLPLRVRRNFFIVASTIRNALGVPGYDPALTVSADVLREIRNKLETFLDQAIKSKSMSVGDSIINEVSTKPMNNLHKFILQNQQVILKNFKEEPVALDFFKGIGVLSSYNSKWTTFTGFDLPTVSTADQVVQTPEVKKVKEAIKNWLESKNEIAIYIAWFEKKKKNKAQFAKRALLVGFNRIATFKPTGKVGRECFLLDVTNVKSSTPKELQITVQEGWSIVGESEETDHIVSCIRRAYEYGFPTNPVALKPKYEVQPATRMEVLTPPDKKKSESLVIGYKAACAYLNVPIKPSIVMHVSQVYTDDFKMKVPGARVFNLKHVYKHTIDTPSQSELEPLIFALRHNWNFGALRVRNIKLENKLWTQVVDVMRLTANISSLTLDNTNASTNGITALAEALQANKTLKLRELHIANSALGDKGITPIVQYLASHPNAGFLTKLNLSSLGLTSVGLGSLATDALPKCTGITYLNISGNKLAYGTDVLVNWVLTADNLQTLILAGTGFKIRMLAPMLSTAKSLTTLDLSNRKIWKKTDLTLLGQYAAAAPKVEHLNLDRTQLPIDAIKEIGNAAWDVHLENNVLGLQGVQAILATKMLDSLKELRLDDTELTDEGVTALATSLVNHPTLRILSIGRGFKGSEGSKNRIAAVQAVAKMLQARGALEVFHMPGNTSAPYQLRGHMGPILAALHENNVLTDLDISYHGMLNAGAVGLSKLIGANYTLSTIVWDGNGTGTLGFANVKNALKRNLALRFMPVPIFDVTATSKDDRVPLVEKEKMNTLLVRIQSYLNRNQQL